MTSLFELWAQVLNTIQTKTSLSPPSFNLWFRDLTLLRLTDTAAYISVEQDFKLTILATRYLHTIEEALEETIGFPVRAIFLSKEHVDEPSIAMEKAIDEHLTQGGLPHGVFSSIEYLSKKELSDPKLFSDEPKKEEKAPLFRRDNGELPYEANLTYNERYSFDNFITGASNQFAYSACLAVAQNPSHAANPLFLYGPPGVGKTHLLYAITNELIKKKKARVLLVRGEDFTNEVVNSLHEKRMDFFRKKYRNIDVLLVDDIQFIAGREATQVEFFNTFDVLHEKNKQIILSSDRPPKEFQALDERLKSRFAWGLTADIQRPDLELRMALFKQKSQMLGIDLPNDVTLFLADQITDNVRQIEGIVKKLQARSYLDGVNMDLNMAKGCLSDLLSGNEPLSVTIDKIFQTVSSALGVSVEEIKGRRRTREIAAARHAVTYLLKKLTDLSLIDIGRALDRDHATVINSIKKMEQEIESNAAFAGQVKELMREVRR